MYKKRIKEWGLDKKNKNDEMLYILHRRTQRLAIGKSTKFKIRGQILTEDEMVRYFKRKYKGVVRLEQQSSSVIKTPPHITYGTPSPEPGIRTTLGHELMSKMPGDVEIYITDRDSDCTLSNTNDYSEVSYKLDESVSKDDIVISEVPANLLRYLIGQTSDLPSQMSVPTTYDTPEKLFKNINYYLNSAIQSRLWKKTENGSLIRNHGSETIDNKVLDNFEQHCYSAVRLIKIGSHVEYWDSLSQACGLLYNIVHNQNPSTLSYLFGVF